MFIQNVYQAIRTTSLSISDTHSPNFIINVRGFYVNFNTWIS